MRLLTTLAQAGVAASCLLIAIGAAQAQGVATQQSGMTAGGAALGQATGPNGAMAGSSANSRVGTGTRAGVAQSPNRRQAGSPRPGAIQRPLPTTTAHPVPRQPGSNASAARQQLDQFSPLDTEPSNRMPTSDGAVNRFDTN